MTEIEKRFNFAIVSQGKLYRSAQPDKEFLAHLHKEYGIKTIVVLRTEIDPEEEKFCQENNISLVQLPIKSWRRQFHPKIKVIKDIFAGAVLFVGFGVIITWILLVFFYQF